MCKNYVETKYTNVCITIVLLQIYVSKKWGFTSYERDVYEQMRDEGRLENDGCNVKYRPEHGPLENWKKTQVELAQAS